MSKITNDGLTRSGTELYHMTTVGVKGLNVNRGMTTADCRFPVRHNPSAETTPTSSLFSRSSVMAEVEYSVYACCRAVELCD